jgi:hypothetical protein
MVRSREFQFLYTAFFYCFCVVDFHGHVDTRDHQSQAEHRIFKHFLAIATFAAILESWTNAGEQARVPSSIAAASLGSQPCLSRCRPMRTHKPSEPHGVWQSL